MVISVESCFPCALVQTSAAREDWIGLTVGFIKPSRHASVDNISAVKDMAYLTRETQPTFCDAKRLEGFDSGQVKHRP